MINIAKRALPLLDLTTLGDNDSEVDVKALCTKAVTPYGHVAAICVWPWFVELAKSSVSLPAVHIAAVANFPEGTTDIDRAITDTREIIVAGGHEVDVVFPYKSWMNGNRELGSWLVNECKKICGDHVALKVILETGELKSADLIHSASIAAIQAGADFIKTSTGKSPISATLDAARIMLGAIKEMGAKCGFKASGGISDTQTAGSYIALADEVMGEGWVSPKTFRFGASGLLDNLIAVIEGGTNSGIENDY